MKFQPSLKTAAFILLLSPLLSTCGSKNNPAAALLCTLASASHDSASLTVGLSSAFLDSVKQLVGARLNLTTGEASDGDINLEIKSSLNKGLKAAGADDLLKVSSILSVPKGDEDDGIRFLELSGSLAGTTTLASSLLKDSSVQEFLSSSFSLTGGEDPLSYLEDSYKVTPTLAHEVKFNLTKTMASDYNKKQWAYSQTEFDKGIDALKKLSDQKDEVVVAVIDTGVDLDHPALEDVLYKKDGKVIGYNYVKNNDNADDDQGHGTHCAGIIAAEKKGTEGMVGVAQAVIPGKVKIMPVKVLGADGGGSTASINKGIRFAIKNGADVISMSLGGAVDFKDIQKGEGAESKIIRDAVDQGIIVVVAAGNENCPLGGKCEQKTLAVFSSDIDQYTVLPCSYNGTICIGASDPDLTVASYSNYPSQKENGIDPKEQSKSQLRTSPDIVAPGTAIYATYPGGDYKILSGTSMATPYVAGLAAIFKMKTSSSKQKGDGTVQRTFWNLLQNSVTDLKKDTKDQGDTATRRYVGQVDFRYYADRLSDLVNGTETATKPSPEPVEGPEQGTDFEAPNLVSLLCGG